jgi:hypothetical protein
VQICQVHTSFRKQERSGGGEQGNYVYMRTGIRELALIFKINYLGGGEGGEGQYGGKEHGGEL